MSGGTLARMALAILVAFAGLYIAAHAEFELSGDKVGLLVTLGGVLYAYWLVKAHFDAKDRE
ncbi:MAG: hypothetical protein JWR10_4303 [Rubritepida sp.]|nr:hypothetical protein [Rubritepida sp.]